MALPTITRAWQDTGCVMLILVDEGGTEPYPYALVADDPYGDAPALREELARMVDAGELVVEPAAPPEYLAQTEQEPPP